MRALLLLAVASLGAAAFTAPTALADGEDMCAQTTIEQSLVDAGKLTQDAIDADGGVAQIRCGDITGDGIADALFSVASGGTAGATHFGVLAGTTRRLITYRSGYKLGLARRTRRSFEVLQPHYGANDPNCCPSSFRITTYTWDGSRFKAGKARKSKTAPARFRG
jgi:hypothetical protein